MEIASEKEKEFYKVVLRHDEIECIVELIQSHHLQKITPYNAMIIEQITHKLNSGEKLPKGEIKKNE